MRRLIQLPVATVVGVLVLGLCTASVERVAGQSTDDQPTITAGDTGQPGQPDRGGPDSTLAFQDCTASIAPQISGMADDDRELTFGCGLITVPRDYDDPDAGTLDLTVVRVRLADQTNRIGSLLVNPGGPGASGLDAAVNLALHMSPNLLARFDLIGFDPRGVGQSEGLDCVPDELKDEISAADPDPSTPERFDALVDLTHRAVDGCWDTYGDDLADFTTVNTARDMDRIRAAVGDERLTYLGFSYGTLLGAVYAELFPDRVRALVLDGAIDPAVSQVEMARAQAQAFENAFDQFAAACAQAGDGCPIGPDARAAVTDLMDQARAQPIPSSTPAETRAATAGNILVAVLAALYDKSQWSPLALALDQARQGDSAGVFELADLYDERQPDGSHANIMDANITINCDDSAAPVDESTARSLLDQWRDQYPLFGASQAMSLLTCSGWRPERHPVPPIDAQGSAPILVVGTTHDPATPYAGAEALADELTSGALLTWDGQGHTAYLKTPCVTNAVDAYLADLTVPSADTVCPPAG